MEYINGDNMSKFIEWSRITGMLSWKKIWQIAVDVASALSRGYKIFQSNGAPADVQQNSHKDRCFDSFMLARVLEETLTQ